MIHKTAIIDKSVKIGKNTKIGPYSVIRGNVIIGDNTYIASHVSIGEVAEHSSEKYELINNYDISQKKIFIGSNVVIREFTTINQPIKNLTVVSNNCYIMARSHISHDNYLEEGVILATNSCLGGWTRVMKNANIGLGSITHQFTTIGAYAMIAANSTVVKDIPPFCKFIPNKYPKSNAEFAVRKFNLPQIGTEEYNTLLNELNNEWENVRHKDRKIIEMDMTK